MRVLAEIYAAQDRVADANRVYDQAADIVKGILVNVPSREAQVGRSPAAEKSIVSCRGVVQKYECGLGIWDRRTRAQRSERRRSLRASALSMPFPSPDRQLTQRSLARAIVLPSQLHSAWAVSDATSTVVMRRFYENLATVAAFQIIGIGDHRIAIQRAPQKSASASAVR
jgi:hypothetical protein